MSTDNIFQIENKFYAGSKVDRISKLLAHYELYKKISSLDGDIIEFGVFKGVSLIQWATFRDILGHSSKQKIIGFDTFDKFPKTEYEKDKSYREKFVEEALRLASIIRLVELSQEQYFNITQLLTLTTAMIN